MNPPPRLINAGDEEDANYYGPVRGTGERTLTTRVDENVQTVSELKVKMVGLQEQVDMLSPQIVRNITLPRTYFSQTESPIRRYFLFLFVQKIIRSQATVSAPVTGKRLRQASTNDESEEENPGPLPTGLVRSFLRVTMLCSFCDISEEVTRILATLDPYPSRNPTVYPDYDSTKRSTFPKDDIHIHFPTLGGFLHMLGLDDSQLT